MPVGVTVEVRSVSGLVRLGRRMHYHAVRPATPGRPERVTVRLAAHVHSGEVAAVAWRMPS
jgi:hypothetical protein